ncbi:DnaJ domain-containing protein [Cohnella kolymensis]|uniref:DnaJ domain-containing protein n=1 Tax=Cohnella kolymensis TaxID=1590652 RepID=UPI000698305B|nr:DnaJ domain-containing protein [Cohnella kolymensis]
MAFVDYYQVLGISKVATTDEIKKAFKKKAKELHPDVGGSDRDFIRIKLAYDILSNPKSRYEYDELINLNNQEVKNSQSSQRQTMHQQDSESDQVKRAPFVIFHWKAYLTVLGTVILLLLVVRFLQNPTTDESLASGSTDISYASIPNILNTSSPIDSVSQSTIENSVQAQPAEISKEQKPSETGITQDMKNIINSTESAHFTLGSSKKEVKAAMGDPDTVEKYQYVGEVWSYGSSSVDFNTKGKVEGWSSIDDGRAFMGNMKSESSTFTLNSTAKEVVNAMGTPDTVEHYEYVSDVWRYGLSSVTFNTQGKVEGWTSIDSGKAFMGNMKSESSTFTLNSTAKEVVEAMGTPDAVEHYEYVSDVWRYGLSTVTFSTKGKVQGWSSINSGKAFIGNPKTNAEKITEGSTKKQVIDALGTPDTVEHYEYVGDEWRYGSTTIGLTQEGQLTVGQILMGFNENSHRLKVYYAKCAI